MAHPSHELVGHFLLEVDRLKSMGNICDIDILIAAHKTVQERLSATGEERPRG
ncbi:MAG: hypothetical protein NTU95_03445 [Methanothrix sp.]|nr:hypothetical protein [Methanothrix sp.]